MTDIAICVDSISKRYRLGTSNSSEYGRLSEAIVGVPRALLRGVHRTLLGRNREASERAAKGDTFWALRDVSFNVRSGEVCGIIGRNGAGKSTLLKVLSRITEPTSGRFGLSGRVASLLEVGTGFHPELTGRENIFLSGITLGMKRSEVRRRFDEIVDFSGVEKFLDTPVKHYSSGMQVRLGFSVAAHLESEILIIDEVLAVGDASFQKKCLGKLNAVAGSGRTALFVSHNLVAVRSLCSSAVLIDEGRVAMLGDAASVVAEHLKTLAESTADGRERVVGVGGIKRVVSCQTRRPTDYSAETLSIDEPLDIELNVELDPAADEVGYGVVFHFYFEDGTLAFASASPQRKAMPQASPRARLHQWNCRVPAGVLNEGQYVLEVLLIASDFGLLGRMPDMLSFETFDTKPRGGWYGKWVGVMRPVCDWTSPP